MRVISGSARGHRLKSLKGLATRPTTDKVKESLFNMIAPYINGAYVLDLFAGTGSLGIETLSRGAAFAEFVDNNPAAVGIISENLVHTKLVHLAKVVKCDWRDYINRVYDRDKPFDIILMDPPYSKDLIIPVLGQLGAKQLIHKDGMIVVEAEKGDNLPESVGPLQNVRIREYGRTIITLYS